MIGRMRGMWVLVSTIVWASTAAAQGLYWESTTTGAGGQARSAQFYAMPKMMKIVPGDGQVMIMRNDQDKLITIDAKKQSYREMGMAELEGAAQSAQGQMAAARAQMEQRMKELSPEQRAMMEKMMPNLPGAPAANPVAVAVKNTGETKTISGYSCTKYVASEGDKTVLVAWTTKDVKGFEGMRDDWLKLQKRLAARAPMFGGRIADAYGQIEGFPIETEMGQVKTIVTKLEARNTPATEFEVPSGYKQEMAHLPKAPQ